MYLFDEFDAIGGRRTSANDVGEIRRVLNSFLGFLEMDDSESLIIGATNHATLLDHALFRRFDAVLEYGLSSRNIAIQVMRARLAFLDTSDVEWEEAAEAAEGLSHAEITHACEQAAKNAILENTTRVSGEELVAALQSRRSAHS